MTAPAGPVDPKPVDWARIGRAISEAEAHYVHHAPEKLYGEEFYAAVARRALGGAKQERLTYETVHPLQGLMTVAEHEVVVSGHTVLDRLRAERAEEQVKELRAEVIRIRRDASRDAVKFLREWCNERRIPARLRREGFLMAADQIDPDAPRDQYGQVVSDGGLRRQVA